MIRVAIIIVAVLTVVAIITAPERERNIAYSKKCKEAGGIMLMQELVCVKPDGIIKRDEEK